METALIMSLTTFSHLICIYALAQFYSDVCNRVVKNLFLAVKQELMQWARKFRITISLYLFINLCYLFSDAFVVFFSDDVPQS